MSSIPGGVGNISYPMFVESMITRVLSGFFGYIWLDKKIVLKKKFKKKALYSIHDHNTCTKQCEKVRRPSSSPADGK